MSRVLDKTNKRHLLISNAGLSTSLDLLSSHGYLSESATQNSHTDRRLMTEVSPQEVAISDYERSTTVSPAHCQAMRQYAKLTELAIRQQIHMDAIRIMRRCGWIYLIFEYFF